jgi:hypothetical protein
LKEITTGINLKTDSKLVSIVKTLSNKHMSMMLLTIDDQNLQKLYGNKKALIRCY